MMIEDEELRNLYQIASEDHLQKLETGLQHLEQHPDDEATWEQLRREAHSLKGDSRSVGVESVEILIQQIEEIIKSIKHQPSAFTPTLKESLDEGLEAINLLVKEAVTGQQSDVDPSEILDRLKAAVLLSNQPPQEAIPDLDKTPQLAPTFIEDEELRNLYQVSSEDHLQKLEAGLQQLEKHPDDETTLEQLLREAHSLKGDSRSVGLETVEIPIHQIEEILGSIKHKPDAFTPKLSDCLYEGLDAIALLIEEAVTGQVRAVDTSQVLDRLTEAVWQAQQPAVPPSEEPTPQLAPTFIEDDELRNVFKLSSQERLQKLEAGLLHLEKHPDDASTLEQLLREAHSLKGDSRSVGVESVEILIHQIEEILGSVKHQPSLFTVKLSDCLYEGLDTMGLLVEEAVTGRISGVDLGGVLERLKEVVAVPSEAPSPPAQQLETATPAGIGEPYRIDTIRVQTPDLDALMTQVEELTVTKIAIAHATTEIEELVTLWEDWKTFSRKAKPFNAAPSEPNPYQERLDKIINSLRTSTQENRTKLDLVAGELREKIRTLRLLPLSTVFQLFPRMVRDLARQQGKEVELIVEGGETTADKRILEEIKDSLMHLIRNAIDHGIETPEEREQAGKPPVATIWLRGYQTAAHIAIEVKDDGRGLDLDKIKQTAIKRKLYRPEELDAMTPSQIYSLILAAGFSTRTFITEISGRGIGLDVVRSNVEQLKGTIQIESTPRRGCTFRIQLGTTLATAKVLLVEVQGIVHALPVEFVKTSVLVSPEWISTVEGRETINLGEQDIPVANLADLLELSNSPAYHRAAKVEPPNSHLRPCILIEMGEEQCGLFVDRLLDAQEVVLKPQSQLLKRVRHVTGATILPTGEVCTILNPPDLLRASLEQTLSASTVSIKQGETFQRKSVILLVEDSIPVRTQEKRLFERAGYEVVVAVDGLDGYNKLQTRHFDAVVSDVEMPNLDGLSLTAKIRQHSEYQNLPIVLVTTLAGDEDKRRGADAGADAYIIKGKFNQDVLLETLERLV
jgi:two-component system chemotaxis sensor kinase CheA